MLKLVEDHYPMPLGGADSGDKGKDAKGKAGKKGTKSGKRKRGLANGDAAVSGGQQPNGQQGDGEPQSGKRLGNPNIYIIVAVILTLTPWVCIACSGRIPTSLQALTKELQLRRLRGGGSRGL